MRVKAATLFICFLLCLYIIQVPAAATTKKATATTKKPATTVKAATTKAATTKAPTTTVAPLPPTSVNITSCTAVAKMASIYVGWTTTSAVVSGYYVALFDGAGITVQQNWTLRPTTLKVYNNTFANLGWNTVYIAKVFATNKAGDGPVAQCSMRTTSCPLNCIYGSCEGTTCACQPGYGGAVCDQCAIGYTYYPTCTRPTTPAPSTTPGPSTTKNPSSSEESEGSTSSVESESESVSESSSGEASNSTSSEGGEPTIAPPNDNSTSISESVESSEEGGNGTSTGTVTKAPSTSGSGTTGKVTTTVKPTVGPTPTRGSYFCGDRMCNASIWEDCVSCPQDCDYPCKKCGDTVCDSTETCTNCPEDCGPCNFDTVKCAGDGECSSQGDCEWGVCVCYSGSMGPNCEVTKNIPLGVTANKLAQSIMMTPNPDSSSSPSVSVFVDSITERDVTNGVVTSAALGNLTSYTYNTLTTSTYTKHSFSKNLQNTAIVTVDYLVYSKSQQLTFAGQTISVLPSTVKIILTLDKWPFASQKNTLDIAFSFNPTGATSTCDVSSIGTDAYGNMRWIKVPVVDGTTLFGQFELYGEADTVSRMLTITKQSSSSVLIKAPSFWDELVIDPNFSFIAGGTTASGDCGANLNDDEGNAKKDNTGIIVGVVVGVVGAACIAAAVVVIMKRRGGGGGGGSSKPAKSNSSGSARSADPAPAAAKSEPTYWPPPKYDLYNKQ